MLLRARAGCGGAAELLWLGGQRAPADTADPPCRLPWGLRLALAQRWHMLFHGKSQNG